jgi:hypothetical protein
MKLSGSEVNIYMQTLDRRAGRKCRLSVSKSMLLGPSTHSTHDVLGNKDAAQSKRTCIRILSFNACQLFHPIDHILLGFIAQAVTQARQLRRFGVLGRVGVWPGKDSRHRHEGFLGLDRMASRIVGGGYRQ